MIEIGKNQGMQLLDDSLVELYREGKISKDSVLAKASDPLEILNKIEE
jgi:Tfp pilus assembly ATPase PilU